MHTHPFRRHRWLPRSIPLLALVACAPLAAHAAATPPASVVPVAASPAPVAALEVSRYTGTWLQLAAIPQPFSLACALDTRAEYGTAPGGLTVRNSCTTRFGTRDERVGFARVTDPSTNAQLAVTFRAEADPATNYVVTALDPEYRWALVVNPGRTAGFVLSREPVLEADQWAAVRAGISTAGMDACLFLTSPITGGRDGIEPLCAR
ncbi:lipocalin family protein [Nocardia sp. 2]|uniref:Lipocalin family protein n=1 Tax=Nocardia acididurans TaxID=2802282 RepID=A0ABS1MH73_9NOCA|nr:lipocalin family protein [Nocardia acididurans]MBL1079014.1 lipocalin family protein [Nocardia acididurans]